MITKPKQFMAKYRLEIVNFLVGAAVLTFELAASRMVAPYIGTSIYVWTSIIGVILGALALGYSLGGRVADLRHKQEDVVLLLLLAAILLLATNFFKDPLLHLISAIHLSPQWQALAASLLLFAAPTVVLGMISPYLARLNISSVASSGRKVASISTWGTIGSLFGTFLTGYVLFGFVGTRNILCLVAFTLVVTSFVLQGRRYLRYQLLIGTAIVLAALSGSPLSIFGVTRDLDTRYGRVMVRDMLYIGRPVCALQVDQYYMQSAVYKDGDPSLVASYTQAFAAVVAQKPAAKDFLIIGGGAFTVPMYLQQKADARIDVVEIDGQLQDISKTYFGFRPNKNMHVITTDGRQYLNLNTKKYDVIFVDAYSSGDPPFQLFTREAVDHMAANLKFDGIVVVNIISPATTPTTELLRSIVSTYQQQFQTVSLYQADPKISAKHNQNLVLIASTAQQPSPDLKLVTISGPGPIFTDNFTPLERLVIR